jgi:hypothetical protein
LVDISKIHTCITDKENNIAKESSHESKVKDGKDNYYMDLPIDSNSKKTPLSNGIIYVDIWTKGRLVNK